LFFYKFSDNFPLKTVTALPRNNTLSSNNSKVTAPSRSDHW